MKKPILLLCVLLLFFSVSVWAKDFGLILDQSPAYAGSGDEGEFEYTGLALPRFSALFGDNADFYISAAFRADYQAETWAFLPELLRTEISWHSDGTEIKAGRMLYSDPLGFIANGLFDGARFSFDTASGTFSAGGWYTGFLYKKRANITMTAEEQIAYDSEIDYNDFADTYFASSRVIAALDWEHLLLNETLRLKLSLLGQFDLSDSDIHSQYAVAKITFPVGNFIFDLGGSLGLVEASGFDSKADIGLAGEVGIGWMLPTAIDDRLSFIGRFSSGLIDGGSITPFMPVTTATQGDVFKGKLSALSVLSLDYKARLQESLSMALTSSYFIRSDLQSYQQYGSDGYMLGNEFFGRLLWSPVSDLQLNLGGGIFLPAMGDAAPDADSLWRVELNIILSLY